MLTASTANTSFCSFKLSSIYHTHLSSHLNFSRGIYISVPIHSPMILAEDELSALDVVRRTLRC